MKYLTKEVIAPPLFCLFITLVTCLPFAVDGIIVGTGVFASLMEVINIIIRDEDT